MDLLSQRYASAFFVLDEFIHLGQLHEFVITILNDMVEEKRNNYQWEFFLHKVFDKTYEEFINGVEKDEPNDMTDDEIKDIVSDSQSLLDLF